MKIFGSNKSQKEASTLFFFFLWLCAGGDRYTYKNMAQSFIAKYNFIFPNISFLEAFSTSELFMKLY